MVDFYSDQAAGLRQLFSRNKPLRVVSFVSGCPEVGKTALIGNLAVCLARMGEEVLLIDEHSGPDNLAASFGLHADGDLLQVLNKTRALSDVLLSPTPGVNILPAAQAIETIGRLNSTQRGNMQDALCGLERPIDVLLIDAGYTHPLGFSPLGLSANETVLVISANENAITDGYALVKRLSTAFARREFRVLINKSRNAQNAGWIQANLTELAKRQNLAKIEAAAVVPFDPAWRNADKMGLPLITSDPECPAALAIRELSTDLMNWPQNAQASHGISELMERLLRMTEKLNPISLQTANV